MQFGRVSGPEPVFCGPDVVAIEVSRGTEWETTISVDGARADGCGALSNTSPSSDAGDYEASK